MKNELYDAFKARQNELLIVNVEEAYNQLMAIYKVIEKRNLNKIQAYNKIKSQVDTLLYKVDVYGGYNHERYKGKKHDIASVLTENYFMDKI